MKFAQSVRNGMYKLVLKGAEGGRIEELTEINVVRPRGPEIK